jgi:UPF0176 protein
MKYQILLYYKYIKIDDPQMRRNEQREICQKLELKGRIIVSEEGINGTLEGTTENTEEYIKWMNSQDEYKDIHYKKSEGTGDAFPKLKIKARDEVVSAHLGEDDIDPNDTTGKYLEPEELHEWFESGKEFYIVDMRNDYEFKVGFFQDSILPPLSNFRDLPKIIKEIESLKDKTVLTVCTGGIRCEKASGFLVKKGFKDVYQLHGGIHSYMERYPNKHFKGKLYVFDGRITMGFNMDSEEHEVVGRCDKCGAVSDEYADCAYRHCTGIRHFITCNDCKDENGYSFCSEECREKAYVNETSFIQKLD